MVVAPILGVVKLVPVPKAVPPVGLAYQFNVPAEAVAPKVTVPASHRLAGVVLITDGKADTVIILVTTLVSKPLKLAACKVTV